MRKSILLVVLALALLLGVGFASAADLTVRGGTIQVGSAHVLNSDNLDENGVELTEWGLNPDNGMVSNVCIGGFEEHNFGNSILVVITDINHEEIARSEGVINATEMCFVLNQPVKASDIFDFHV